MEDYRNRINRAYVELTELLGGLKDTQQLLRESPVEYVVDQRALAVAITELETAMMWLDKSTS